MSVDASTMSMMSLASTAGGIVGSAGAARLQAQNQQFQARMAGRAAEQNAKLAEWQAQDAERRGGVAARNRATATQVQLGRQRSAIAGSGIRTDSGTALAILDDTRIAGDIDVATIRDNAAREAAGARIAGASATAQGRMMEAGAEAISPNRAAINTILGSAGTVADRWYRYNRTSG